MFAVRRLIAVGSILSLAALLASSNLWGTPGAEKDKNIHHSTGLQQPPADDAEQRLAKERGQSRFADQPVVLYQNESGETFLALQVKPHLTATAARPRDYLILVDTAAHMANGHLNAARDITRALIQKMDAKDRLAIRTVNTRSHDLSQGFQPATKLGAAVKKLAEEYPAGAVNLNDGLRQAVNSFDGKADRQRVIVFLGSGQSLAGPIDADLRATLCKDMIANQIAFHTIPLGANLEPYNLHGFANGTGGKVVRLGLMADVDKCVAKLLTAVAQPILYDGAIRLPDAVDEAYPAKLPPLRPDVPTLIVGKIHKDKMEPRFGYRLSGKVAGENLAVDVSEKMPKPAKENFFLVNMVEQWKSEKDRPALIQADRALGFAYERSQLARADLVAKAEWALEKKKFDVAHRLYQQALQADPSYEQAKIGLRLVEELRSGKRTLEDVKKMVHWQKGDKVTRISGGRVVKLPAEQLYAQPDAPDAPPLAPPDQANRDPLADIKARQAVADQEQRQVVEEAVRRARTMVRTDPDAAHDFLKRSLDSVLSNPDISNAAKANLGNRLERAVQDIDIQGAVVKRDQAEALNLMAAATARSALTTQQRLEKNRIRERMRVFHTLMDQAREQRAYLHAQAIRADLVNQGIPVPSAVTAGYKVGLHGYHLREVQELRRIRNERWLATMLSVDRSHIPFPDEPPVEYPPPAIWKALSDMRKARYEVAYFGSDMPARGIELQKLLGKQINYPGLEDPKTTLDEVLNQLAKAHNLSFDINEKAFKFENVQDVAKTPIADPNPIPPMNSTVATVLRRILQRINVPSGATFIIRRDVIEITTGLFAGAEKTIRVYPVADLVTPIPAAVNPQMLQFSSQMSMLGYGGSVGVLGINGANLIRGLGALGALGGALGLGALGGIGGLGGFNGIAGVAGIGGIGAQGFQNIGIGGNQGGQGGFQGNFQGQGNLGMGGLVGFGGQAMGQFGNLGGQFGIQGGNTSNILTNLIRQVVGKPKDWAVNFDPVTGNPVNPLEDNPAEGLNQENNQLGFYAPAQALVIKATATIHNKASNLIIAPGAGAAQGAMAPGRGGNRLAAGNRKPKVKVAGAGNERPDDKAPNRGPPLDPRTIWSDALAKGVEDPGLIIATADFLVLQGKFDHAAEFLKANLRQGIITEPWVYKSLAIALRESGGSTEDIERAEVSAADLMPQDARSYLQAAQALAGDEKYGLALAFCKQAALLEPGTPHAYTDALNYAELARDSKAMEWAAGNLLRQDWPVNNKKLQDRAVQKMESLAKLLEKDGRKDEAQRLLSAVAGRRQRDLIVKLNWQGEADLDLHVIEPTGSICTPLNRQTIGGGVLIGDSLADMSHETYLAAEAFPGDYEIEIEKIWGHPLNGKAQLKIIRHQGTPDETEELRTVEIKSRHSQRIKLKLTDGRRKETAYVAPRELQKDPEPPATAPVSPDHVLHQLRAMADPDVTGVQRGFGIGLSSEGGPAPSPRQVPTRKSLEPTPDDRTLYQMRVKPFLRNSLDVTAQAVLSSDRRYVRLSLTPVFNTVAGMRTSPVVVNPVIPGAR